MAARSTEPLERRRCAHPSGAGTVSHLDPVWVQPVDFLPYVPPRAKLTSADREQREDMLAALSGDLGILLRMPYHIFWSQILHDKSLMACLESYLRHVPRWYDECSLLGAEGRLGKLEREVNRQFFMVFLRLSTDHEASDSFMTAEAYANLIYDNWVFDVPKLLDLCAIYGRKPRPLLSKMVGNIFAKQPKYHQDLDEALTVICGIMNRTLSDFGCSPIVDADAEMTDREDVAGADVSSKPAAVITDALHYIVDIGYSLCAFVCTFTGAGPAYVKHRILTFVGHLYESLLPSFGAHPECPSALHHLASSQLLVLAQRLLDSCHLEVLRTDADASGEAAFFSTLQTLFPCKHFLADWDRAHGLARTFSAIQAALPGLDAAQFDYVRQHFDLSASDARDEGGVPSRATADSGMPSAERMQHIANVQEMLPHLGQGFIDACLDAYNDNVESTINHLLEGDLHPDVENLPQDMPLKPKTAPAPPQPAAPEPTPLLSEPRLVQQRSSVFDGDEFDVFSGQQLDMSRVYVGKRERNTGILDDKSHVREFLNDYLYEDEYDDTYDGLDQVGDLDAVESDEMGLGPNPNRRGRRGRDDGDEDEDEDGDGDDNGGDDSGSSAASAGPARGVDPSRSGATRGRGRGGRGRPANTARERAVKDRQKSSRANHNRKRGADAKRNRGMGAMPPA
eukprot:m.60837 g.60837  ORF g.60837 m.60837 type:complete len:681 (-) comp7308_c0_seq1:72-2114(-)